ncbi:MAG TPA: tyrosine-type recombinase/integrase [Edaphobacter sp.]|jgi:integrase|nr:tyrosine-type recombinase/integrase [Edaphobacter sp.]
MKHTRKRYQLGSLTIEKRSNGQKIWVYRWREQCHDGATVQRKKIVGTKQEYPTKTTALKAVEGLRLDINVEAVNTSSVTVDEVIAHYKDIELADSNSKTTRTKEVYRHQFDKVISPKWGSYRLSEVKPIAVEKWLNEMPVAPGTRYKTKGVMSILFQHAMRYEWATVNPIRLVRQSAIPSREEIVLLPVEVSALLSELHDPFRTLILLASVTGLRRGELFGLKWDDIDFAEAEISVVRSVVDQIEGPPKTLASRRPIPMSAELSSVLANWRTQTSYSKDDDWVFASPLALGAKPYWPDAVLKRHVFPAAERAGIAKRIGWHSFRRTLATLLQSSGASVKTTQELLRHASPGITMGVYAKAVTADKRKAQDSIAALFVGNSLQSAATT